MIEMWEYLDKGRLQSVFYLVLLWVRKIFLVEDHMKSSFLVRYRKEKFDWGNQQNRVS